MLKKILVGLVAFGVFGFIAWRMNLPASRSTTAPEQVESREPLAVVENTGAAINEALKSTASLEGLPKASLAPSLSNDVMLLMSFGPREFDQGLHPITDFITRLNNSSAGKKLNGVVDLTAQMKKGFEEGWNKNNVPGNGSRVSFQEIEELLGDFLTHWKTADRLELIVSRKTFSAGEKNPEVPLAMVRASMNNEASAKALLENLKQQILKDKERLESPEVSAVLSDDKAALNFTFRGPQLNEAITAVLLQEGSNVELLLGAKSSKEFMATDASDSLASLPAWKAVMDSRPEDSTVYGFVDSAAFTRFFKGFDEILSKIAAKNPDQAAQFSTFKQSMAAYEEMTGIGFASRIKDGLSFTACSLFKPDSKMLNSYQTALKIREASVGGSSFDRLLDAGSILAIHSSIATASNSIDSLAKEIQNLAASSQAGVDEKDVVRAVGKLQTAFSELGFQDIGFLVGPPIMPPIVGAGLFFGNSKLSGEPLLQSFVQNLNSLASEVGILNGGKKAGAPLASLRKQPDGSSEMLLNVGGLQLVGGLVAENSVVISIDESMVKTFAQRFKSGAPFFAKFKVPAGIVEDIQQSDYYVYLQTETLISLLRNFLPTLLAMQQQEPRLELAEAEEIMNMLNINWLHLQKSYSPADKEICLESKTFLLDK